jgi:hypothetical protein
MNRTNLTGTFFVHVVVLPGVYGTTKDPCGDVVMSCCVHCEIDFCTGVVSSFVTVV